MAKICWNDARLQAPRSTSLSLWGGKVMRENLAKLCQKAQTTLPTGDGEQQTHLLSLSLKAEANHFDNALRRGKADFLLAFQVRQSLLKILGAMSLPEDPRMNIER